VVVWDISGRITFWNSAAEDLFGWQPNQMTGAIVTEDYFPLFFPFLEWKTVEKSLNVEIERKVVSKDLEDIWISSKITCLTDGTPNNNPIGYMDVLRDITIRKKAEEERRKLSSAVQQTADSVIITNKDGHIEYVNPAFEKLTGYSLKEAIGKDLSLIRDPQADERLEKMLWQQSFQVNLSALNSSGAKNPENNSTAKRLSPHCGIRRETSTTCIKRQRYNRTAPNGRPNPGRYDPTDPICPTCGNR